MSKIFMSRLFPMTGVAGNWAVNLLKLHLCFRLLIAVAIVASFIKIRAATRAFVSQQATMPSMFHYSTESICSRSSRMNFQMFVRYRLCDKFRKLSRTTKFTNDTNNKRGFFFFYINNRKTANFLSRHCCNEWTIGMCMNICSLIITSCI